MLDVRLELELRTERQLVRVRWGTSAGGRSLVLLVRGEESVVVVGI